MKYPNPAIGDDVIENFNEVRLAVKADEQMFVFRIGIILIKKTVVFSVVKSTS